MKMPSPLRLVDPDPLPPDFDEALYLEAHADVREAVAAGGFASAAAHYRAFGRSEGRSLRPAFMRVVRNVPELDAEIEHLRELERRSFSEWLRARASFRFQEDIKALPSDPFSSAYRLAQMELYEQIAGVTGYNPWKAEPVPISVKDAVDPHPFPFSTQDGELIGGHMVAIGNILRTMWGIKPGGGHRILEYGCGTGFSTITLAASRYQVTAVDINADALKVIDTLAAARGLKVTTFNGEFGSIPDESQKFDIILFYESFHHCLDFIPLLGKLHDQLAPDGTILFAGEPIFNDFPKPWGLRLDGASLWEIRTKGWLELGFREDFFLRVLAETGWEGKKLMFPGSPDMFVAHRSP